MSNVEPNLWGDHASTESRVHRGWHRSHGGDDRRRSHTRQASQGRSVEDDQTSRGTSRRGRSRQGLASRFTAFLRLMAGTTAGSKKSAKKRRPERRQQDEGSSSSSSESSDSSEESESPSPVDGHRGGGIGPTGGMPGMPVYPPPPEVFAQMPPRQPAFHPQGPRPPGPPFFNQPPFHPGPAPPRPPSSLQSGSERSSSRQSSTSESSHPAHDGPPAQPPIPQRTAFYGEPKYAEYQLPGERRVSPEPALPSALAEDVEVSPWTDVTRVSWTKGRVGDVEDEPLEGALPIAGPPPFPPGPSGMRFGAAPGPPFQTHPLQPVSMPPLQPGNMPPPGMQPFPGQMPFVPGNRPFPAP